MCIAVSEKTSNLPEYSPAQVHWPRRRFSELSVSVSAAWVLNRSAVAHYNILHISRHRWQTPRSSSLALSWGIPGLVTTILSSPLWPPHNLPLGLWRVCPLLAYRPQFFKSQYSNKSPCHTQINYVNYGIADVEKVCCSTVCEYLLLTVQSIWT